MIRDITLGQYFQGESWIHKLDARVKIIGTMLYIVALFVVNNFVGFAVSAAGLAVVIGISRVPLSYILKGLKPVFFIIIFTFLLNIFMYDGRVLVKIWVLTITEQGLYKACFMALRLILLIIGSSILTLTTKPMSLTDGIEKLLYPAKVIGVPAHELAMMMTIALRFIPTLLEETDKIMKAQQARGADFETGSIVRRAKHLVPILVPLFIGAFRIAQDMAMAMESRCYRGGQGRTRMTPMKFYGRDLVAALSLIAFLSGIIVMRILM